MATLSLSYTDSLSFVTCSASSLSASATVALFERSIDQIHWTQVRGGAGVPVVSGAASVTDYEFSPGVVNYYRVSAIDTGAPSFVGSTAAVTANNASVTPTLPTYAEGDLLVIWCAIRNSGAGAVVCPTGWTVMLAADNVGLFGRRAGSLGTEVAPTVAATGGVAGADVIAQMACFRNCERTPVAATTPQKNPSAANITFPGLFAVASDWAVALYLGWRQSSWTSPAVATVTGATAEIGEPSSTLGGGAGLVWDYRLEPTVTVPVPLPAGAFTVTGGGAAISYGAMVMLRPADFITRTVASVTPFMNAIWLKCVNAPYLNRSVTLIDWADNQRASRMGTFSVHGQIAAVAFTDVASPRSVTMSLWVDTVAERQAIELVLSVGLVVLVHVPPTVAFDSGYFAIGTYTYTRPAHRSLRALLQIPLTEVVAPDVSIVGNLSTWSTLLTNYATWNDVLNANASWQSVLNLVGTPVDVLWSM
ncbi:MAG: hypothetical protein ACRDQU_00845 [Pseudonocardiaceae bacterium]